MRPIRLELKGFTAFRDEQVVDFEELDLFAISGPTGSGKSSILDAVTYALFGYVERVGRQCGQLISQGQSRMAVCFEFAVDDERFRVTRSTPTRGATKILLERWDGVAWQRGEGADKVRDVDEAIRAAVGLDYDAFTRTVLLPQGRFAEFLVGDARQRRSILTDLLGLELFERLAKRAGECKREAQVQAETRVRLLETEYTGVTPGALAGAEAEAKEGAVRLERLAEAEVRVRAIADRWTETARSAREVRACATGVKSTAAAARASAASLTDLEDSLARASSVARAAATDAEAAATAAREARAAIEGAREAWGSERDLVASRVLAGAVASRRADLAQVEARLREVRERVPALAAALASAQQILATRVAAAEAALERLAAAKEGLDEATHADLVAAVRAGARAGEPCPVCGAVVASLPKSRGAATLAKAKATLAKAEEAAAAADEGIGLARSARDRAEVEAAEAIRESERVEGELEKTRSALNVDEGALAAMFDGTVPADPVRVLDERLARLDELRGADDRAEADARAAKEAAVTAERALETLDGTVGEVRGRLEGLGVSGLLERARALAGPELEVSDLPSAAGVREVSELAAIGRALAGGLEGLSVGLEELAVARETSEASLLDEAAEVLDGLAERRATLADTVEEVSLARTEAAGSAATAEQRADLLREKLANAATLAEEVTTQRARAERFDALAKELRADRIVAFLQLEALQVLAAAGSERLATLSSGRYRLEYDEDEFFVVDTWNGEERRSARTLSGGETFLASLALALALSEQVRSLSVTEKARLDSLFLDEGFGTLDPDSLEVVVDAIEQLGGDGRMVGVITHVQELAVRLPARIEVEKSPRGSRLRQS